MRFRQTTAYKSLSQAASVIVNERSFPDPMSGCWIYLGSCDRDGYGKVGIKRPTDGRRINLAHRVVWEATYGEIPADLEIDHICRTPTCVNIHHLRLLTHAENAGRGIYKPWRHRNARKTHCKRGHELVGSNVILEKTKRGTTARKCRICKQVRLKARMLALNGLFVEEV